MIAQYDYPSLRLKANLADRTMVLEFCTQLALRVPGAFIEFGVADGSSTRVLATLKANRKFYALDSFEGLREKFENAEIGTFACKPPYIRGAKIVTGYFEQTCTAELAREIGPVAFAHLDADLYSSTLCALRFLTPLLGTGSILLFDEFLGGQQAEKRSFDTWRAESGVEALLVAAFARDPSGYGTERSDCRTVFQIVKQANMPVAEDRHLPVLSRARELLRRMVACVRCARLLNLGAAVSARTRGA
jgi:Macrocin-O-methyltransferase (TylF)